MTRLSLVFILRAMQTINIHEAKTHLSRLIERVTEGEEIVIGKSGRPVVKIVPFRSLSTRVPGSGKGKIEISPDFDQLPADLLSYFSPHS